MYEISKKNAKYDKKAIKYYSFEFLFRKQNELFKNIRYRMQK